MKSRHAHRDEYNLPTTVARTCSIGGADGDTVAVQLWVDGEIWVTTTERLVGDMIKAHNEFRFGMSIWF